MDGVGQQVNLPLSKSAEEKEGVESNSGAKGDCSVFSGIPFSTVESHVGVVDPRCQTVNCGTPAFENKLLDEHRVEVVRYRHNLDRSFLSKSVTEEAVSELLDLKKTSLEERVGAFGRVGCWKATDGRKMAVKILDQNKNRSWQSLEKGEICALLLSDHPNIVKTHCVILKNLTDGVFSVLRRGEPLPANLANYQVQAVVSDWVEGVNISDVLDNEELRGRVFKDPDACLEVAIEICKALLYVHEKGLIYRDLKPDNVMINPHTGAIKLIDFGFCKQLAPGETTSTFCGSPKYRAPEMITQDRRTKEGAGCYGSKVDAWGVGGMLLTMLCNRTPGHLAEGGVSSAEDRAEVMKNILSFSGKPFEFKQMYFRKYFRAELSGCDSIRDLICKLLARNPESRPGVKVACQELQDIKESRKLLRQMGAL